MNNLYNLKSIYNDYIRKNKKISYKDFKLIIEKFNKKISEKIIEGYKFKIGHNLGCIMVVRIERTFKLNTNGTPISATNWGESKKIKKKLLEEGKILFDKDLAPDGEQWLVYYTDKYYVRWIWNKNGNFGVKNSNIYNFKPTWSNRRNLASFIKEHDNALFLNYNNDGI